MILPVAIFLVFQIALRSAHDFHHACLGLFEVYSPFPFPLLSSCPALFFNFIILFYFIFIKFVPFSFQCSCPLILHYRRSFLTYFLQRVCNIWEESTVRTGMSLFSPSRTLTPSYSPLTSHAPPFPSHAKYRYERTRAGTPNVLKEGRLSYPYVIIIFIDLFIIF